MRHAGQAEPRPLSEVDVALFVPPRVLERGRDYLLLGRVGDLVRHGSLIAGRVEGSDVYVVTADLSGERPATACTCPLRSQPCKHAAALLLSWAQAPSSFTDLAALAAALRARPGALEDALARAFAGAEAPSLDPFLQAAVGAGAPAGLTWDAVPIDAILDEPPDLPGDAADELWSRCAERVAGAAAEAPASTAARLETVWRWASLALWARRAPGIGSTRTREAVLRTLKALGAAAESGARDGTSARRLRVFDRVAQLASALERREYGDMLRLLRAAWRILPGEAAERWSAVAGRAAAEARWAELNGQPERRAARAAAARAWAAGWIEAGQPERAAAVWEVHADLDEASEGRVRAWVAAGDWARARDAARAGLERAAPSMVPWFRRQLALALMRLGRPAEAAPYFAANFEETPTVRAYRDLRAALQAAGGWTEAARAAAERLAAANWPETEGAVGRVSRWRAVAEVIAEDAPLLALRFLAAAIAALRRAGDGAEADALRALGERIADAGGEPRRRAWLRMTGEPPR